MSDALEKKIWEALRSVKFPGMSRDIVSFGFVDAVKLEEGRAEVALSVSTHSEEAPARLRQDIEEVLGAIAEVREVVVEVKVTQPQAAAQQAVARDPQLIPEVQHVVAVASGKGGVGKSTVAANLAVALGALGYRVGLLDADIYGPSLPLMFGINERPRVVDNRLIPFDKHGVRLMSLGFILDIDTPVVWRGPMVMRAIEQMLGDVDWGPLDYMIVDLPPGTGDAQLTISQKVPLSGAVIVTTPQDLALIDARKGLAMFRKVNVPIIGIIENMSGFVCPHCGESTEIFKRGGGERTAGVLECEFLGRVPLDPEIMEGGDSGTPVTVSRPDGPHAASFRSLAEAVASAAAGREAPRLSIF